MVALGDEVGLAAARSSSSDTAIRAPARTDRSASAAAPATIAVRRRRSSIVGGTP
jgi:hypothetical protein